MTSTDIHLHNYLLSDGCDGHGNMYLSTYIGAITFMRIFFPGAALTTIYKRLFEGDQDIDVALKINTTFGDDLKLSHLIHQTDMVAPPEVKLYYQSAEYKEELAGQVIEARAKLDADDLGQRVLSHWRSKEAEIGGEYHVIIAGALLMRAGAKIEE
ncbi:hypothetical protein F4804DRAFT_219215 [Jackrogersella minutella]|nr:hypothetical protein F4804DRAFT_219215 [Jackrogersella minutella]